MMLLVALQETRHWNVERYVVTPNRAFPYGDRHTYGLYQKIWFERRGMQKLGYVMDRLIPQPLKRAYGLVADREIDVVLDASGFAYSDQWGPFYPGFTAKSSEVWKRRGCKFILLPQAFGPFRNPKVAHSMRQVFNNATAIYARDRQSQNHVRSIYAGEVRVSPDFTNLLDPREGRSDLLVAPVAIIPNARMIDKVKDGASGYLDFLASVSRNLGPDKAFFLIHEGVDDLRVAERVNSGLAQPLKIVSHEDPLVLKWILSKCEMVVGSRFHALISALSQGVPTYACGWSHKYEELFSDYEVPECLIDLSNPGLSANLISDAYHSNGLHEIRVKLSDTKLQMKRKSIQLWQEITTLVR
ncbi:polysaccharide pyruvyl transferase family protein [Luteimonas sp. RC10]|uniref:polysaccharide pyruvyl transferase family protein n=1 Tax=Luteimonas sp. RC10 TaxID=2587035 RepID=UPI001618F058|nr:polysaccharide pyruvyl transferase family protein [Luteimonas sp. RC10]MBB3344862.1 colanic acid/amylovoran biosynthesis protein [Luteimonas sp. RC10]